MASITKIYIFLLNPTIHRKITYELLVSVQKANLNLTLLCVTVYGFHYLLCICACVDVVLCLYARGVGSLELEPWALAGHLPHSLGAVI